MALRGFEVLKPYESDGKWMERCIVAVSKENTALIDLVKCWDVENRTESVGALVEGGEGRSIGG